MKYLVVITVKQQVIEREFKTLALVNSFISKFKKKYLNKEYFLTFYKGPKLVYFMTPEFKWRLK